MNHVWLFLHVLGFSLWLGGGVAAMFAAIAAKGEDRAGVGAVVRALSAIWRAAIGPGALLAALSGLMLTFAIVNMAAMSVWLMVMQGAGLLGALIVLAVGVPTATKVARIDPAGPDAAYFDELRNRMKVVGMVSGTLALIALVGGVWAR